MTTEKTDRPSLEDLAASIGEEAAAELEALLGRIRVRAGGAFDEMDARNRLAWTAAQVVVDSHTPEEEEPEADQNEAQDTRPYGSPAVGVVSHSVARGGTYRWDEERRSWVKVGR